MANDPGESIKDAAKIKVKKASRTFKEFVGESDRSDFYSFSLSKKSSFNLSLKGLQANADVFLLNAKGKILDKSRKAGRKSEDIITTLKKGTYYIKVSTRTGRDNTSYQLAVSTRNTPPKLTVNKGTAIGVGETETLTSKLLKAIDSQQSAGELTYTLNQLPTVGRLELNGTRLEKGDTFTQTDINKGRVTYTHTGQIIQLTNNTKDDFAVGISGSNVVWNGFDGNDYEVFLYNGTTGVTKQLTNNSTDDFANSISGLNVVWTDYDQNQAGKSYFYNGTTGTTTLLISPGLLGSDLGVAPLVSGSKVIWTGLNSSKLDLFLYDDTTKTTSRISNNSFDEAVVAFNDSYVVYNRLDPNDQTQPIEVFLYNIATDTAIQISNGSNTNSAIGLSGSKVYWNGSDGNDYEVFSYDVTTAKTTNVTNNNQDDLVVAATGLSGTNLALNRFDGTDFETFFYNASTNTSRQLTDNSTDDVTSGISGANLIWSNSDANNQPVDVLFYNGTRGITTQLTNDAIEDFAVGVSGSNAVWNRFESTTDSEVILAKVDASVTSDLFKFTVNDGVKGKRKGTFKITIS